MENAGEYGRFHRCKALNYLAVNSCNAAYAAVNADAGLKSSSKASCLRKCLTAQGAAEAVSCSPNQPEM